jgi:hypothetical protein
MQVRTLVSDGPTLPKGAGRKYRIRRRRPSREADQKLADAEAPATEKNR